MAEATDPWTSEPVPPAPASADSSGTFVCPHCGTELVPHHDAVGSLHCYDQRCVNCCFLPPDEMSLGRVQPKFEAKPCPAARAMAGAF